jgi:alkanesulfonate monooxygenase SsuD/methylene tetrahydromethanopterin reductase-like flavin-dependent oxidoreductase (luciferase family)
VARDAEAAGFDSLWVYERLLFPAEPADGLYGIRGLPWPSYYEGAADPLTVLAAAAAVTDRIRPGSSVLCAPLHHPVRLAKALAHDRPAQRREPADRGPGRGLVLR